MALMRTSIWLPARRASGAAPVADDGWGGPIAALRMLARRARRCRLPPVVSGRRCGRRRRRPGPGPDGGGGGLAAVRAGRRDPRRRPVRRRTAAGRHHRSGPARRRGRAGGRGGTRRRGHAGPGGGTDGAWRPVAATDALLDTFGADAAVAVIGPAGEHRVRVRQRRHVSATTRCPDSASARSSARKQRQGDRLRRHAPCRRSRRRPRLARIAFRLRRVDAGQPARPPGRRATRASASGGRAPGYATVDNFRGHRDRVRDGARRLRRRPRRVAACPGCPTDCVKVFGGAALHQEALAMLGDLRPERAMPAAGLDPVSLGGTLAGRRPASAAQRGESPWQRDSPAARPSRVADRRADGRSTVSSCRRSIRGCSRTSALAVRRRADRSALRHRRARSRLRRRTAWTTASTRSARSASRVPREQGALDPAGTAILMRLWSGLDALNVCLFAATPTRPLLRRDVEDLVAAVTGERPDMLALGARRLQLSTTSTSGSARPTERCRTGSSTSRSRPVRGPERFSTETLSTRRCAACTPICSRSRTR